MKSVYDNILPKLSILPTVSASSTRTGSAVDCIGVQSLEGVCIIEAMDHTTGDESYVAKLQYATDSAFTSPVDVTGASFTFTNTGTNVVGTMRADRVATLGRYFRMVLTMGGTTPSVTASLGVLLLNNSQNPNETGD